MQCPAYPPGDSAEQQAKRIGQGSVFLEQWKLLEDPTLHSLSPQSAFVRLPSCAIMRAVANLRSLPRVVDGARNWIYGIGRSVNRVISDGTPSRSAKPGHSPVPLLT